MKKSVLAGALVIFCGIPFFAQERFRKSPPLPEPLPALQLPALESFQLENGLTVALAYRKNLPLICVDLAVPAGECRSPENLPGLATFTAQMLGRGTMTLSASDIEERIESIGGSFAAVASLDQARLTLLFLKEYADQALDLLSRMILQPSLSDKEIVNLKRTQYYDFLERRRDPVFVGQRQLGQILFRNHPYRNAFYNEDVVMKITRKDILAFYEKYYRPNNAVVVLAGDLDLATVSRKIRRYFSPWTKRDADQAAIPPPQPNREDKAYFVHLPRAQEATIILGNVIFSRADPDFFPFSVVNQVLGGTPNSRLFMILREAREYAYFAFSEMNIFRCCGVYSARAKVVPSACYAAVQEILGEIKKMTQEKIPTSEIEQAKSYLIGNFPLKIEKPADLARWVSEIVTFSLGDAYWNKFYEDFMLVDADRAFEVAQKYLLAKPVVVIVGDKDLLFDPLQAFEKCDVYDAKGVYLYSLTKGVK